MEFTLPDQFVNYAYQIFMIAGTALGFVYLFGRMLGILKKDIPKNILASTVMLILSFYTAIIGHEDIKNLLKNANLIFILYESIIRFGISIVVYVLFLWRMWWRSDKLLDKKVGSDEGYKKK